MYGHALFDCVAYISHRLYYTASYLPTCNNLHSSHSARSFSHRLSGMSLESRHYVLLVDRLPKGNARAMGKWGRQSSGDENLKEPE